MMLPSSSICGVTSSEMPEKKGCSVMFGVTTLPAALVVGAFFFVGGVMAARMIPAPGWFIAADLICAYFPFAWLGHWLARPRR